MTWGLALCSFSSGVATGGQKPYVGTFLVYTFVSMFCSQINTTFKGSGAGEAGYRPSRVPSRVPDSGAVRRGPCSAPTPG